MTEKIIWHNEKRWLSDLIPYEHNPRTMTDKAAKRLTKSLKNTGYAEVIAINTDNIIVAGHQRHTILKHLNKQDLEIDVRVPNRALTEKEFKDYLVASNKDIGDWDYDILANTFEIDDLLEKGFELPELGIIPELDEDIESESEVKKGSLLEKFGGVPVSVFDARSGIWQNRKRAWVETYQIDSCKGRKEGLTFTTSCNPDFYNKKALWEKENNRTIGTKEFQDNYYVAEETQVNKQTSIFDPVLCELLYRWFCPKEGKVFDPFAGGSVRGLCASVLNLDYTGIDLSKEQIEENNLQWNEINCATPEATFSDPDFLTPIEQHGELYIKRDDLFEIAGVRGGKVRTCFALAKGATGLITAGSRQSPQVNIVAHIAKHLGIPCRVHTPQGELSPEVLDAKLNDADIIQHKAGYNSVIIKRAKDDSEESGWVNIPFGMECQEAIEQTRKQVKNIPPEVKRIVIPVGSGMSLAGLLHGLKDQGIDIPVVGIMVGADPKERLNKYAPKDWNYMVTLINSGMDYHKIPKETKLGDLQLDPIYEAKCLSSLEKGDLLWVVGIRATKVEQKFKNPNWIIGDSVNCRELANGEYDFIIGCPPYGDLEKYTKDPSDLSNMKHEQFIEAYRKIIKDSCAMLKENRFAAFIVGDFRNKEGNYRNFVSDTISAFLDAGLYLYNEAVLVTSMCSLPMRISAHFNKGKKLGKSHQNVLVFVKGNGKEASNAIGDIEFVEFLDETENTNN